MGVAVNLGSLQIDAVGVLVVTLQGALEAKFRHESCIVRLDSRGVIQQHLSLLQDGVPAAAIPGKEFGNVEEHVRILPFVLTKGNDQLIKLADDKIVVILASHQNKHVDAQSLNIVPVLHNHACNAFNRLVPLTVVNMNLRLLDNSLNEIRETDSDFGDDFNALVILLLLLVDFGLAEHSLQVLVVAALVVVEHVFKIAKCLLLEVFFLSR